MSIKNIYFLTLCFLFATGCSMVGEKAPSAPEELPEFRFPAAVNIVGPDSRIVLDGSSFMAGGGKQLGGIGPHYGYQLGASQLDVDCTGKNGIATESPGPAKTKACVTGSCVDVSASANKSIIGSGGQIPNIVHGQNGFTLATAQKFWKRVTQTSKPLREWDRQGDVPQTDLFGSNQSPAILHYREDATISNLMGTGILIIDGNLNVTGRLYWQGIILVGICPDCDGTLKGTGDLKINGTLVLNKTLNNYITFTGKAQIGYSCQAIEKALSAITKLKS